MSLVCFANRPPFFPAVMLVGALLLSAFSAPAQALSDNIIRKANRADWIPGVTVGVRGGIPGNRTNLIDVTKAPFNADRTGSSSAVTAIKNAITAAQINDVIYLPNGVYNVTAGLTIDKSGVTVRGESPNTILVGHVVIGHVNSGQDSFSIVSGFNKGSTNMTLATIKDRWGSTLSPGHLFSISGLFDTADPVFQHISTAGYIRTLRQIVTVNSVFGNSFTFSPPLVFEFTNAPLASQRTDFQLAMFKPAQRIGLENLTVVSTRGNLSDSTTAMVELTTLVDSWVTGCTFTNANNYPLKLENTTHCEVAHNFIGGVAGGSSHAGLISADTSGTLIQNNIFSDNAVDIMFNEGFCGNAIFANFFNSTGLNVDCHNTHPVMNLWEQNQFHGFFQMDGYFGSASHQTLFRNRLPNTTTFKRWTTYMQVVGNVCGNPGTSFAWTREEPNYGYPRAIFEMGFPNMGNALYTLSSPAVSFNWPQKVLTGFKGETIYNGVFTFTNTQVNTNVLYGNFTNIPAPNASNFPLKFQDGVNTNKYWPDDGTVILAAKAGTSTSLVLQTPVTVSNGWTLYIAGVIAYQQLQTDNKRTHTFHGNLVYTNAAGSLTWDPAIADRALPASLLYSSPPSWWGTNRWPFVDPLVPQSVGTLPAENRFLGIPSGTLSPKPPGIDIGINDAVAGQLSVIPTSGRAPLTVNFAFSTPYPSVLYFGDGSSTTNASGTFTYTVPGVYTMTVNDGKSDRVKCAITVTNAP